MTVNVEALREIIPVLRELDAADRFYMDQWAAGRVTPDAADWHECGTAFCMAGAKAVVDGWRPQYEMREIEVNGEYVEAPFATGYFVAPENRHERRWGAAQRAERIARDAFGLSPLQADFLFYASHITRVDDLVRRIEHVIEHDGEDPWTSFPTWMRDEEFEHRDEDAARQRRIEARIEP